MRKGPTRQPYGGDSKPDTEGKADHPGQNEYQSHHAQPDRTPISGHNANHGDNQRDHTTNHAQGDDNLTQRYQSQGDQPGSSKTGVRASWPAPTGPEFSSLCSSLAIGTTIRPRKIGQFGRRTLPNVTF